MRISMLPRIEVWTLAKAGARGWLCAAFGLVLMGCGPSVMFGASGVGSNLLQADAVAPASTPSGLVAARGLVERGHLPEAEAAVRGYLQEKGESGGADFMLGYVLFREGKAKESLGAYTRGARLATPTAHALMIVALDYVLLDDYVDAQRWLLESTQRDGSDAEAWYSLGRVQYKLNRFDDAVRSLQRSLELTPRSVKAADNLGLALAALNRGDEAVAAYRQAIAWQADAVHPSEQPLLNLGSLLLERNQLAEATQLLERAVAIAPNDAKIQEELGRVYLLQNCLEVAASHLEQAVTLAPEDSRLHFQLGQVYRKLGRTGRAKAEFERTAELNGTHSTPE